VEFDDTSLGRPRRGVEYSKVITPGYIFEFDNGVDKYTYHTDKESLVVFVKKAAVK
jgi:hypothetical protein